MDDNAKNAEKSLQCILQYFKGIRVWFHALCVKSLTCFDLVDQESIRKDEESKKVIDWLSRDLNFVAIQRDIFAARAAGTGEWLLDDLKFKTWINGTEGTLWCHGMRMNLLDPT